MADLPIILFAGGGTGGHIFPNLAISQRLAERGVAHTACFVVSERAVDQTIVARHGLDALVVPARPLSLHPVKLPGVLARYGQSRRAVARMIAAQQIAAVVGTGGFVSGPALAAGAAARIPAAMINLDAVPGRAHRLMARKASVVFSAGDTPQLSGAIRIGVPLRPEVFRQTEPGQARRQLGLDPDKTTLLITAGSQGARSINQMMIALCSPFPPEVAPPEVAPSEAVPAKAVASWGENLRDLLGASGGRGGQVLHQAGEHDVEALRAAYASAGVSARVVPFVEDMGLAWSAADLAISRAGAGSVAEVWARAVPTLFMPYPYHRDQHQKLNAGPLVEAGGVVLMTDHVDPAANAAAIAGPLVDLMRDADRRAGMREALRRTAPRDGAVTVADWLAGVIEQGRP